MSGVEPGSGRQAQAAELTAALERAITGDAGAFEQLVIRTERRVLNVAWKLLGSLHDAQDAAQEVFIRTFKYLHRYDIRKPFEPWLMRITVNVCRDVIRRRRQSSVVFAETGPTVLDFAAGQAPNPHSVLVTEQQKQFLRATLSNLPEKERAAIVLRDLEGFSTAEVAEILQSSEATVRSQISSARLKIRMALKGGRP
jgi:RNA polymerase sigma-70 factor (ECF subfamily)